MIHVYTCSYIYSQTLFTFAYRHVFDMCLSLPTITVHLYAAHSIHVHRYNACVGVFDSSVCVIFSVQFMSLFWYISVHVLCFMPLSVCTDVCLPNSCWGMRLYYHCICRDTMTRVMSLPIKAVMEYKAHNISLKYEYHRLVFSILVDVYMWDQDCYEMAILCLQGLVKLQKYRCVCAPTP